jgi:hypothetical protein
MKSTAFSSYLALGQGVYFFVTGIWPVLSLGCIILLWIFVGTKKELPVVLNQKG